MKPGTALAIMLSLLLALVLQVVRLPLAAPEWLGWLRPPWLLLAIVFWTLAVPTQISLIGLWLLGFAVDALNVDPLGLNGALLAAASSATHRRRNRVRMYPLVQQVGVVFLLVLGFGAVCQAVRSLAAEQPIAPMLWGPALVSALVWPLAYVLLRYLRPHRHIVV